MIIGRDEESEEEEVLAMGVGRIALAKAAVNDSVVELDRPRGQFAAVVVEELAIVGLVIVNVTTLLTLADGWKEYLSSLAGLITWLYVLILTSLRLALSNTPWRTPGLWSHTAAIYFLLWFPTLIIFRSSLIHPNSRLSQILVTIEFSLLSLLFIIALIIRKGNKAVALKWEGNLRPSQEQLASLISIVTFSWADAIVWEGYKKTMELGDVWNLVPRDKAIAILADYRKLKKTSQLPWHLLKYFRWSLCIQCILAFFSAWITFAPTLLLKAILEYIENPGDTPRNVIWLYVILLSSTDIIRSALDGQALWIGRKVCIHLRAIIIGEIYAKALRRKAATNKDTVLGNEKKKEDPAQISRLRRILRLGGKKKKDKDNKPSNGDTKAHEPSTDVPSKDLSNEQVNVGTIINLMSVDSFKVAEICSYFHFLLSAAPTQLAVCIILLYRLLGLSAMPGLLIMVLLLPINIAFAMGFGSAQKKIMTATDKRINTTNEILQNIRIIKFFAWESRFVNIVNGTRAAELRALRGKYIIWACAGAVWNTVPIAITFFSFLVYTLVEKKPLYPSVAFTAISLFTLLRVPLDQLGDMIAHVLEAAVSVSRVEEFLNEEETEKYELLRHDNVDEEGNRVIGIEDGTFTWGGRNAVSEDGNAAFRLMDIDIKFAIGKLNIVAGPTGSGKTSLLMALLGEMTRIKGKVFLPGGYRRENVRPDPETHLAEAVAYCAQQAWLVNASIRENILFAAPMDEERYRDVIVACALERDLESLDAGDETLVGEKGITLSGGQKQRISLARALYSNSRHLLLDDCLSAVDSHTAKWIFDKCIIGPLMCNRTCVLVTHNIALCMPFANYAVVLDNGRISIQGTSAEVMASGKLGEETLIAETDSGNMSSIPSHVPSDVGDEGDESLKNSKNNKKVNQNKICRKNSIDESKAEGRVKFEVMILYLKSMGPWWFWVMVILVFGAQQLAALAASIWVKNWASQYDVRETLYMSPPSYDTEQALISYITPGARVSKIIPFFGLSKTSIISMLSPDIDVKYYLAIYALIGLSGMAVAFFRDLWLFYGSLTASSTLHRLLMDAITRAKFKFFDVTPLGQIMNRFSKDLESVDQEVAPIAIGVMGCALAILVTVVLISSITPGFLIAAFFIGIMYLLVATFYIRSSRDLKRLESVQRSPLFQQFGETLTGITTIRAYGDENRFVRDNMLRVDNHNRPFIFLWATNRWLAFRIDAIGDLVSFFAGAFVIMSLGSIDAGSAGLTLSYAISFTENVLWLVRLYSVYEQNMNAVERIKEYLDIEQEAEAIIEKSRPAANWPCLGAVEFINYTTRYRPDLEPALRNINFKIYPGEKVGVVGRTGAGKSSLALALFRALEAEDGKILIDDVNISLIGLQDLRDSITIVPQDPTLFTGTIRSNLDPFDLFTDEEIFAVLRRVQLIGTSNPQSVPSSPATFGAGMESGSMTGTSTPANKNIFVNLSSTITESGSNLSQGQRQLLCLARALLKSPRVLLMDEATASIDYTTDSKIQETIRELKSTIITIAHRLQTIIDYDKVLVLDRGQVVEYGHPHELLKKEGKEAVFRGMCEMSGDFETLQKAASRAFGDLGLDDQ